MVLYKIYYLNDELFFFINHQLNKRPQSLVVFGGSKALTMLEIQKLYEYSSLCKIQKLTIVHSQEVRIDYRVLNEKGTQVEFLCPNSMKSEILSNLKGRCCVGKADLIDEPASLVVCIGKKGMNLPGLPVWCMYSAEFHYISCLNPLTFFKTLEKYSLSEQRNGR